MAHALAQKWKLGQQAKLRMDEMDQMVRQRTAEALGIGVRTLGLKLNFADLAGTAPSGIMLKADDNLAWQPATARFGLTKASSDVAHGTVGDALPAAVLPERRSAGRRAG